jgi:hypothetical protein
MKTPWDPKSDDVAPAAREERGPALQDVRIRFGVTLSSAARANVFAMQFRGLYPRCGATVIGDTAWCIFRCGALDAHEASLQAAAAVRVTTHHKLVREEPRSLRLHDFDVSGPLDDRLYARALRDREVALRKAVAWGLLRNPLVESAAAAQLVGRLSLPHRRPAGPPPAVGGPTAASDSVSARPPAGSPPAVGGPAVAQSGASHRAA